MQGPRSTNCGRSEKSSAGSEKAAAHILEAYERSGICAPRLLPRIGITEGNRQSFTLGMLMTQIIDPERYNALTLLWEGDAPPGERLADYVRKQWEHQPHEGETPVGVAHEVMESARRAAFTARRAAFPFWAPPAATPIGAIACPRTSANWRRSSAI